MAGITTAMMASYKRDLLNGAHCHAQSRSFTCTSTATTTVIGISPSNVTATPIYQGEAVSGTNIAANTVVSRILSATSIQLNIVPTSAITAFTVVGDTFKMALFKVGIAGTYSAASTNYTDMTGNTDETSGTGYVAGGTALTNVDPVASSPSAFTNFSPNPTWTSASFSTIGCMIYNSTQNGPNATPGVSVHDFGGTQTVTSGTFTAVMPVAAVGTAILQIT
jgi:hypothetical protein